ncbi:MAG TPA: biotin--[acetyl-CoA-carboxylase] ligase [Bryobacteraceae bacterium]|nr:biotin--[acetyl-CoA-carboxylase] ligase [Bryobacteraceae bacterium]
MPLDIEFVRERFPGREIRWYESIDSTMREAIELAEAGCASGVVVGADEQTAGYGRFGRAWHSERDAGLYQTIVLRIPVAAASLPAVTFALGLAVSAAIEQTAGVACDLRWPNDVLIGGRKVAGILTQLQGAAVVAGIGINVNHTEFPPDLAPVATSIRMAAGREQSREQLLVAVLEQIDAHCDILARQGAEAIRRSFAMRSSYVSGRRVTVEQGESTLMGVTAGLTEAGFLRLLRDDGREEIIVAGGIRPA